MDRAQLSTIVNKHTFSQLFHVLFRCLKHVMVW